MTNEQRFLIQSITERMVGYVMEDYGLSMLEAFRKVYNSSVYLSLCDTETGLYAQSPYYVYDRFRSIDEGSLYNKGNDKDTKVAV